MCKQWRKQTREACSTQKLKSDLKFKTKLVLALPNQEFTICTLQSALHPPRCRLSRYSDVFSHTFVEHAARPVDLTTAERHIHRQFLSLLYVLCGLGPDVCSSSREHCSLHSDWACFHLSTRDRRLVQVMMYCCCCWLKSRVASLVEVN